MKENVIRLELPGRVENPMATWKRQYQEDHDPYTFIRDIFSGQDYEAKVHARREREFQARATAEQKKVRDADRLIREADRKLAQAEELNDFGCKCAIFACFLITVAAAILCLV